MFADDTNIYYENDSLEEMEKIINIELKKLWLRINRLSLNISKTNFVIFRPYNKKLKYITTLKIDKKVIAEKSHIKYLGIIIDSSLIWKQHLYNISIKISRSIGILCKLKNILNQNMLINLYYSLIYSHIVYCIQAWGNAGETELNHILILQKRLITGIVKLRILKIKDIYSLQISKFSFNSVNNNIITNFQNWFKLNCHVHDYRTRSNYTDVNALTHSNNLCILSDRRSFYGLKLIKVYGPKYWNTIPNHIRSVVSLKYFSKVLKQFLLQTYS